MPPRVAAVDVINRNPHLPPGDLWVKVVRHVDWTSVLLRARSACWDNSRQDSDGACAAHINSPFGLRVCGDSVSEVLIAISARDLAQEEATGVPSRPVVGPEGNERS